jgi:ParB/RepB/Spo0J family partition protein
MSSKLKKVLLSEIHESPIALRTVETNTAKFQEMVASVKGVGILNPVLLRERTLEDGSKGYEIIEGLHRTTAARAAGLDEIPAQIVDMDDARVMEAQTIGNLLHIDTKASEFTGHLKRMMNLNPMLTEAELADKLSVSITWIQQRLSLSKITNPEVMALIDSGKIRLANAYALAKLPEEEQSAFVEAAMLEPAAEFANKVNERVKEIRAAKRAGAAAEGKEFEPQMHLRKMRELKEAIDGQCPEMEVLCRSLEGPEAGFVMGLMWALHADPESVEKQRADFEARKAEQDERAKKRAAEVLARKKERADLAAKVAANAQAEMEGAELPYPELNNPPEANDSDMPQDSVSKDETDEG